MMGNLSWYVPLSASTTPSLIFFTVGHRSKSCHDDSSAARCAPKRPRLDRSASPRPFRRSASRSSSTSSGASGGSGRCCEDRCRSPKRDGSLKLSRRQARRERLGSRRRSKGSGSLDNSREGGSRRASNGCRCSSPARTFDVESIPYAPDDVDTLTPMVRHACIGCINSTTKQTCRIVWV